jgi:hypothetical protein
MRTPRTHAHAPHALRLHTRTRMHAHTCPQARGFMYRLTRLLATVSVGHQPGSTSGHVSRVAKAFMASRVTFAWVDAGSQRPFCLHHVRAHARAAAGAAGAAGEAAGAGGGGGGGGEGEAEGPAWLPPWARALVAGQHPLEDHVCGRPAWRAAADLALWRRRPREEVMMVAFKPPGGVGQHVHM